MKSVIAEIQKIDTYLFDLEKRMNALIQENTTQKEQYEKALKTAETLYQSETRQVTQLCDEDEESF